MPKDNDRKHQQLMQELALINKRIRGYEAHIKKSKGKLPQEKWEALNRELKTLLGKKEEINRKLRRLG